MATTREVVEGTQVQGVDEQIVYTIDTANWGGTPTVISAVVKDADGVDKTTTVMNPNNPTASGDVITLSKLDTLVAGVVYRVEVKFTAGGNVLECWFDVSAET